MKICVAVLTTGVRSQSLSECVEKLFAMDVPPGAEVKILLAQNGVAEPDPSLLSPSEKARFDAGDLAMVAEPRKGIPFGRNAGLAYAQANGFDYLAFIDDDAYPDADWLTELVAAVNKPGIHAATGPQVPVFPEGAPIHLREAEIYRERRLPEGTVCKWAATNNVIFDVKFTKDQDLWFNEKFATGGSDKEFFLRFTRHGGVIVWTNKAIVREEVISERLSMDWATQRAYRYGVTGFKIENAIRPPVAAILVCAAKGSVYLASGLARLPVTVVMGKRAYVDSMCHLAHGSGFLLGIFDKFRLRRYV